MSSVVPLMMGASGPIIDRNKRDIRTPGQWLRELKENADEAYAAAYYALFFLGHYRGLWSRWYERRHGLVRRRSRRLQIHKEGQEEDGVCVERGSVGYAGGREEFGSAGGGFGSGYR